MARRWSSCSCGRAALPSTRGRGSPPSRGWGRAQRRKYDAIPASLARRRAGVTRRAVAAAVRVYNRRMSPRSPGRARLSRLGVIAACCLACFAGGVLASRPLFAGRFDPYKKLSVFTKVLSYIEMNYVENVAESDLMFGAARGLTDVLDPHSRFMDPEEYDRLKRETEGDTEITGIGIDLERRKRGLIVVSPIEGSPAYKAGIEPGDLIKKIDGTDADSLEWEDAVARIQGPDGSEVVLVVDRRGKEHVFRIRRQPFEVRSVEGRMLDDGYGYVKIRIFSANTDTKLLEALEDIKKKSEGKGGMRGLIL